MIISVQVICGSCVYFLCGIIFDCDVVTADVYNYQLGISRQTKEYAYF